MYIADVERCLERLTSTFGRTDLLYAWRLGAIEQSGSLQPAGRYEMHGTGCTVMIDDLKVDFEFSGTARVGFDAWRLWQYSRQLPNKWALSEIHDQLHAAIATRAMGALGQPPFAGAGNSHLYGLLDSQDR